MDLRDPISQDDDPENILSTALQSLYDFSPITTSTAGSIFTYPIHPGRIPHRAPEHIELATPDTDPSNWSLHASSIWVSSIFLADHLEELQIDAMICARTSAEHDATRTGCPPTAPVVRALELGAGAGLPSILLAHMYPRASVTVSDYPDDRLIHTLSDNIRRNGVSERCRAVPYAWGADTHTLEALGVPAAVHRSTTTTRHGEPEREARFDVVLAADTLWNPELHVPLLDTLSGCLKRGPDARVHLVAGLHTGRYTIQSFLDGARRRGFLLLSATERQVDGTHSRPWDVSRAESEDERDRRRWVVWTIFKWADSGDALPTPL